MMTFSLPIHPGLKCGQRGFHPASWPLSVQLRGVFICIDYVKSPNFPLRDAREPHCKVLPESMRKHGYDYSLGMVAIFYSHEVNVRSATADHLLATEESRKVLNDSLNLVILHGWPKRPQLTSFPKRRASVDCRPPQHSSLHASRWSQ